MQANLDSVTRLVEQERQRANKLAAKLKELGVNPENL